MRKILAICAVALFCAACTVHNPFGGPDLVLTGNLTADMPSIQAFQASLKAGIKADAAKVRDVFVQLCPHISEGQKLAAGAPAQAAAATVTGSDDNGHKLITNINSGLSIGSKFCISGTATDLKSAFIAAVDAVSAIYSLVRNG